MPKVYVVFCMDTEGPCDDPDNDSLLKTWKDVDPAMDKLFDRKFRLKYKDSMGNGLKIGWFFLTWTGFKTNPRGRDFGYHKVRDHYSERWGKLMDDYGDEECWHYHHPPVSGVGNEWSTQWSSSEEYKHIISRQIIEREWFPVCFRAGGTIMDSNLSRWVDRWFPFDYSNRAPLKFSEMDWSGGISAWQPYRPDVTEFKRKGNGKRLMTRCMDLHTGLYIVGEKDIVDAFKEASLQGSSVLSVFDHDYRDIENRVAEFLSRINAVAEKFPEISWEYSSPSDAIGQITNSNNSAPLKIEAELHKSQLKIIVNSVIHQEYPWIAVQDIDGNLHHIESDVKNTYALTWEIALDPNIVVNVVGVAASNKAGESDVALVKLNTSANI